MAASIVRREAMSAAREGGAMATGASWRATATTSPMDNEWPSRVIGVGMRWGRYVRAEETPRLTESKEWPGSILATHDCQPLIWTLPPDSLSTDVSEPGRDSPDPSARSSRR